MPARPAPWQQTPAGLWYRVGFYQPDAATKVLSYQCAALGLVLPAWEVCVTRPPAKAWRWDAMWDAGLLLDISGGTWIAGRHSKGAGYANDTCKWAAAVLLGWRVLIATTQQVADGTAVGWVRRALGVTE